MKKIAMMTALVVGCLCVGAAMAEPEQKKPAPKGPRMERRNNREGAEKRAEMAANRFGGKVVAKDGATVTVKNMRQEMERTFTAKSEEAKKMLEGVAVGDFVGVRFSKAGEGFALDAIRKFEGPRQGRPEGAPGERRMRKDDGAKDKPAGEAIRQRKQDGEGKAKGEAKGEGVRQRKQDGEGKAKDKVEGEKKGDCCKGCPKAKAKEEAKDKPKAE